MPTGTHRQTVICADCGVTDTVVATRDVFFTVLELALMHWAAENGPNANILDGKLWCAACKAKRIQERQAQQALPWWEVVWQKLKGEKE